MFLPRVNFESAESYAACAKSGGLRPGQWIHFEGVNARFARATSGHVVTYYWSTSVKRNGARAFSKSCGH